MDDFGMPRFLYATHVKMVALAILFVALSYLALVEPIGYHTEVRPVHAGPKSQKNYAFLLNPLLFPFSYLAGRGETVYTTYQGKVLPEGFNAESIVSQNFLVHLPFYLILSYIIACVIVSLLEVKKGK